MYATAASSWNRLSPDSSTLQSDSSHDTRKTQGINTSQASTSVVSTYTGHVAPVPALSEWEMEAVKRYRSLKKEGFTSQSLAQYLHSSPAYGALLQLVVHTKFVLITNWHEKAEIVAGWFGGPSPAPLDLLPRAVVHLTGSHQLTPSTAAEFLLDIAGVLLLHGVNNCAVGSPGDRNERTCIVSADVWDTAKAVQCSVYNLQGAGMAGFEHFSSLFLRAAMGKALGSGEEHNTLLLPLCFLIRQCQQFALDAWSSGEERLQQLSRMCDLGSVLPTHIAAILSAII